MPIATTATTGGGPPDAAGESSPAEGACGLVVIRAARSSRGRRAGGGAGGRSSGPPSDPTLVTSRQPLSRPSRPASDAATPNSRPRSGPSSSPRSAADATWRTGSTRTWVGACGLMSRIAITRSSSWSRVDGDLTGDDPAEQAVSRHGHLRAMGWQGRGSPGEAYAAPGRRGAAAPMTRSGTSGSTDVRRTVTSAFSRSRESPARGATATRTWSSAWPTQRPSGRRVLEEDPGRRADAGARETRLRLGRHGQAGRPRAPASSARRPGRPSASRACRAAPSSGRRGARPARAPPMKASDRACARVVLGREARDDVRVDRDARDRRPCPLDHARVVGRSGSGGPSAGARRRRPTGAAGGGAAASAARRRPTPRAARRRRAAARSS